MSENEKITRSVFEDVDELMRRFGVGVREALLDHKRAGNSVAIWRDGKVVIVPPEEIVWDDTPPRRRKSNEETEKATPAAK